jgi:hypothetical protein
MDNNLVRDINIEPHLAAMTTTGTGKQAAHTVNYQTRSC